MINFTFILFKYSERYLNTNMEVVKMYFLAFPVIISFFSLAWLLSVYLKNASIVDIFWGIGFILAMAFYFLVSPGMGERKILLFILVTLWGLRLSVHIFFRNAGKPEDYRYHEFRKRYGEHRYWWFSFFQVFLLQGTLVWIISAPLFAASFFSVNKPLGFVDLLGLLIWLTGFIFEAGGDFQLSRFKRNPMNKGKLLQTGFWSLTRHPNYFGDAMVWWGFGVFSVAAGIYLPLLSPVLMTWLLLRVSGVAMLERNLKKFKPGFDAYARQTSAFVPWFRRNTTV